MLEGDLMEGFVCFVAFQEGTGLDEVGVVGSDHLVGKLVLGFLFDLILLEFIYYVLSEDLHAGGVDHDIIVVGAGVRLLFFISLWTRHIPI